MSGTAAVGGERNVTHAAGILEPNVNACGRLCEDFKLAGFALVYFAALG